MTQESCHVARLFNVDVRYEKKPSHEQLHAAMVAAAQAHTTHLLECKAGQGVDRHLLALKNTGELLGRYPALFRDRAYTEILTRSVLSTSNCASNAIRLFGFGPVVPEGFGIGMSFA